MKKILSKKTTWAILIIIIIIVYFSSSNKKDETEYVTVLSDKGHVVQTVDATGSISSNEAIELNFKTTGKLSMLNVSSGDSVAEGQVLAKLESGIYASQIADAQSAVMEAEANLEKILSGATEAEIKVAEKGVLQKEQSLLSAKNNLENLINNKDTEIQNAKSKLVVSLQSEIIVADSTLEVIKNTLEDEDAENTLGVQNKNSVTIAENSKDYSRGIIDKNLPVVNLIDDTSADDKIEYAMTLTEQSLDSVRTALSDTYNVLEATIISSSLTQTELDTLFSNIRTKQTAISTSLSNIDTNYSNWKYKKSYYNDQIKKAENSILSAENSLALAEAELDLKKSSAEDYEIKAANARLSKARANLELAISNFSDTIIEAPLTGTITEIHYSIGEQTNLSNPVIEMIGTSKLEIEVDIPESDIAKIEVGQKVDVTLDAFGDDEVFPAVVTFINPAETVIQDVVYYQVKIQFTTDTKNVKPGMTANALIFTKDIDNALRVPIRAVHSDNGDKYVDVLENDSVTKKAVDIGLRGDDYIEIKDGLEVGESVITFIKK